MLDHGAIQTEVESRQLLAIPDKATATITQANDNSHVLPWRAIILEASAMWIVTRIVLIFFTYYAATVLVHLPYAGVSAPPQGTPYAFSPHLLLHLWDRWDAIWYVKIAQQGYFTDEATAFFPLFPLLIHLVALVLGPTHTLLAAMIVSNLGSLAVFIGVGLLATQELGRASAPRAIRIAAAYPLAFFMAAAYTESLFVALAVFALLFARRGAWRWAALCAFLAALTRPTGAILIAPLVWEFARQRYGSLFLTSARDWRAWPGLIRRVLVDLLRTPAALATLALLVGAVPFAVVLYAAYLGLRFGHPLIFLHVQSIYWHRTGQSLWKTLLDAIIYFVQTPGWSYWQARQLIDLAPVLAFGVLTLLTIRRTPFSFTLYMLGLLYLAMATPIDTVPHTVTLVSSGRFLVAAVPVFLLLTRWERNRPWLDMLLVGGGFLLQGFLATYFLANHWLV